MDQLRAQLGNYLEWLESRGLTGPVAFRTSTDTPSVLSSTEDNTSGVEQPHQQQADMERPASRAPEPAPVATHHAAVNVESDARSAENLRTVVAPQKALAEAPQPPAVPLVEREAGMPWKVGFYSSSDLTEEEFIMVSRIALALGLPAEDFKIWAEDSLVHVPVELLRCTYIVALGPGSGQTLLALGQTVAMNTVQKALQGSPVLTIPHPRAMLKDPSLKGGAWNALQKFKGLMTH